MLVTAILLSATINGQSSSEIEKRVSTHQTGGVLVRNWWPERELVIARKWVGHRYRLPRGISRQYFTVITGKRRIIER